MFFSEAPVVPHSSWKSNESKIGKVIGLKRIKNRISRPTKLLINKEALIVTTAEMKGAHEYPKNTTILKKEL